MKAGKRLGSWDCGVLARRGIASFSGGAALTSIAQGALIARAHYSIRTDVSWSSHRSDYTLWRYRGQKRN